MKNLIKDYEDVDMTALEDLLMVMAKTVENSFIQAGGVAGKDYTLLDCYKLGQPFALEIFKLEDSKITFSAGK